MHVAYWIKLYSALKDDFVMVYLNDAYYDLYLQPIGKSKGDYLGKTDTEFWGEDIATIYNAHDWEVYKTKRSTIFKESINEEDKGKSEFVKIYIKDEQTGDEFISGMAIILQEMKQEKRQ